MNWELQNTDFYLDGEKIELYELFKKLMNDARKKQNKDELQVYQTVIGESDRVGSNESITNARVIKAIQNMISGNNEVLATDSTKVDLVKENSILEKFVPKMWDENKTSDYVATLTEAIQSQDRVGEAIALIVKEMAGLPAQKRDIAIAVKKVWSKK